MGQVVSNITAGQEHTIQNKAASPDTEYVLRILKATGGDSNSNYYVSFSTDTTVQGYIWNNSGGTLELVTNSDECLKTNVSSITHSSLQRIRDTQFRQFDWISGQATKVIGVIAQEFQKTFPRSVSRDPKTGLLGVGFGAEYQATVGHAIQELAAENDAVKARINTLEERIAA